MGIPEQRQRLELAPDRWHLIRVPFNGLLRAGESATSFMLWTDIETRQAVEVEVNGMTAVYATAGNGRLLTPVNTAMRQVPDSAADMELLLEGQPGSPAALTFRFARPVRVGKITVSVPEKLPGVTVRYRVESQLLELQLDALPSAEDGVSVAKTRAIFPQVRPDPALARVLFHLELEH